MITDSAKKVFSFIRNVNNTAQIIIQRHGYGKGHLYVNILLCWMFMLSAKVNIHLYPQEL